MSVLAIYHRPPKEYRNYLLERRDSLIAIDAIVLKAHFIRPCMWWINYDMSVVKIGKTISFWDMCCGVLEVKHSNHRNIFMNSLSRY